MSDEPLSDGPLSDGPLSDGPLSDGSLSDGPLSDGPLSLTQCELPSDPGKLGDLTQYIMALTQLEVGGSIPLCNA